jgi:hypothetical protein
MKDVVKIIKEKKEIKKGVALSRLLYDIGDIKSTLLDCVIKEAPDDEIIFWVNELWSSGVKNHWTFIWKIFYDFYIFNNSKRVQMMMELNQEYEDVVGGKFDKEIVCEKDEILKKIICGMFLILKRLDKNPTIFLKRHKIPRKFTTANEIKKYAKYYKNHNCTNLKDKIFICSLHDKTKSLFNVANCLYNNCSYEQLERYIKLYESFYSKPFNDNPYYTNKRHVMLAYIILLRNNIYGIDKEHSGKMILKDDVTTLINDTIDGCNDKNGANASKFLKENRKYKIHPVPGMDRALYGMGVNDVLCVVRSNWLNYISKTNYWKDILKNYKIKKINNNGKKIIFDNINEEAQFYEKYGYQPEEQSRDIQMKVVCENNETMEHWIRNFGDNYSNINFPKNCVPY